MGYELAQENDPLRTARTRSKEWASGDRGAAPEAESRHQTATSGASRSDAPAAGNEGTVSRALPPSIDVSVERLAQAINPSLVFTRSDEWPA